VIASLKARLASPTSLPTTVAVARLLAVLVVLVAIGGAIDDGVTDVQFFDFEGELKNGPNLIVMASSAVLFVAAALAFKLARSETARSEADSIGSPAPWYLIAVLFVFMGVDELVTIHEHLEEWTGVDWQILYLPVVLAGAVGWTVLFLRLRASDVRLATGWALGAGLWIFAQFLEVLLRKLHVGSGVPKLEELMPAAEELSELTGSSLFLLVTLGQLESRRLLRSRGPVPSSVAPLPVARDPASPGP
jgi:hypothetical protein